MPQYEISNLPEGYQEIDRFTFSSYVSVIYQNEEGLPLYLDYNFIQQGGAHDFVTTNMDVSDIIVNIYSYPHILFNLKSLGECLNLQHIAMHVYVHKLSLYPAGWILFFQPMIHHVCADHSAEV